jgi:hypothetical protein
VSGLWVARFWCASCLLALSAAACSARRLPPGTPPPEYEPPVVTPWTPERVDAGTAPADGADAGAVGKAGADEIPPSGELSSDAGLR